MTASPGVDIGSVVALAIRPVRKAAPQMVAKFDAIADNGIVGDIHADQYSPRQVLLASAGAYDDLQLSPHTLRENILLDVDTSELSSGSILQVGAVQLWLSFQCEACGHLNEHHAALTRTIGNRRGILARVLRSGSVSVGDRVRLLDIRMPSWSDDWRDRIIQVLDSVPSKMVIEFRQLARLSGVPSSYCRVFPRFIKGLGPSYAGKAIAATSTSKKQRWQGEGFFKTQPIADLPLFTGMQPRKSKLHQPMDHTYDFA